jgi:hypothetical protein
VTSSQLNRIIMILERFQAQLTANAAELETGMAQIARRR